MKIKWGAPKGKRYWKGSLKSSEKEYPNRFHRYCALEVTVDGRLMWFEYGSRKWVPIGVKPVRPYGSSGIGVRSIKAALRQIRKHTEIPKGAEIRIWNMVAGEKDVVVIK